jgi:hypothetical protein
MMNSSILSESNFLFRETKFYRLVFCVCKDCVILMIYLKYVSEEQWNTTEFQVKFH